MTTRNLRPGDRVRVTKRPEPAVEGVPARRLTAEGYVKSAHVFFRGHPDLERFTYRLALDSELLGMREVTVTPGRDSFDVEVLDAKR